MKIKIFETQTGIDDLNSQIDDWLGDRGLEIRSVDIAVYVMHDYYTDSQPPMICNQWINHTATIIYSEKK